jgi:acetylornithine deacetylase/succinyl-diaminopimelate desuccinylase-like protein
VQLNETTRAWLERAAPLEEPQIAADMRAVAAGRADAAAIERLSSMPIYNAQLRTTCVATLLQGGHAENALPQSARATVNCRVLPGEPVEDVQRKLVRVLDDDQISVTPTWMHVSSAPSPLNPEIMREIDQLSARFWPGAPIIPSMSTGATDGSFLRNAGIPTYGHSGLGINIDDIRAHGKDERILVKSFYDGTEYLFLLVKALATAR